MKTAEPKTAEEMLKDIIGEIGYRLSGPSHNAQMIEFAKSYGRQIAQAVRQECADKATTRTNDESTSIIVDRESIMKVDIEQFIK